MIKHTTDHRTGRLTSVLQPQKQAESHFNDKKKQKKVFMFTDGEGEMVHFQQSIAGDEATEHRVQLCRNSELTAAGRRRI